MNSLRYFLPHILALSTNSPFWLGMNTGLKSYRCKVFDKFPRTNIPDTFSGWSEYDNFVKLLIKTNCMDNAKKIWWDVRPHPFFDTVEVRVCDIPMRLDETIALAALIQATVVKLFKLHAKNQTFRLYPRALLMENKWRAVRYGIDGKLIDFGKETEVPERELILEYLDFIDDVVDELGSRDDHQLHPQDSRDRYRRRPSTEGLRRNRQLTEGSGFHGRRNQDRTVRLHRGPVPGRSRVSAIARTDSSDARSAFDPELAPGAHNAVHVCLRIQPSEKVTVITDNACREIAASIVAELDAARLPLSGVRARRARAPSARRFARARSPPTWRPATSASSPSTCSAMNCARACR